MGQKNYIALYDLFLADCVSVLLQSSVADPDRDPDPVGSVYYSLSWIRIRIRILYTDQNLDPAAFKLIKIFNFFLLFLTFSLYFHLL